MGGLTSAMRQERRNRACRALGEGTVLTPQQLSISGYKLVQGTCQMPNGKRIIQWYILGQPALDGYASLHGYQNRNDALRMITEAIAKEVTT